MLLRGYLLLATAVLTAGSAPTPPKFNNSKCPSFAELRSPHVVAEFDYNRDIPGFYYELALHDLTQYPLCPSQPKCISSNKSIAEHSDGQKYVDDAWNLYCINGYYPQTLLFNVTDEPGYLRGYVPVTKIPFLPKSIVANTVFPDTVVDFKPGPDGWVLEFQCVEALGRVIFTGVNFYSKANTEENYQEMLAAGKARGIDFYWNQGLGLKRVNHTGCPPPPPPKGVVAH